jgi:chromosome segregation ATPase
VNVDHQESLEAEVKRLREQLDAALDREAGTSDAYEDAAASASGYRADRDRLREELEAEREAHASAAGAGMDVASDLGRLRERVAELEAALRDILNELGVPDENYAAPVANAVNIARAALADDGGGADEDYLTEPSDGRDLRGGRLP